MSHSDMKYGNLRRNFPLIITSRKYILTCEGKGQGKIVPLHVTKV